MKKFASILVVLSLILSLAACSGNSSNSSTGTPDKNTTATTQAPEPLDVSHTEQAAADCLKGYLVAANADEAAAYCTEKSLAVYQPQLPGQNLKVDTQFLGNYGDYDFYTFQVVFTDTNEASHSGICMYYRAQDGYLLCEDAETVQEACGHLTCGTCQGTGVITSGNQTACGLCGGTGMQYIPNAYFDPGMNMWMGQHMACGGCGGSGMTGSVTTNACGGCGGMGLVFS